MNQTQNMEASSRLQKPMAGKWRLLLIEAAAIMLFALQYVPVRADGSIGGVGDICPFRNLTGLPCPLCGMTRSMLCFFQGDWHSAFLWHPLGLLLGIGMTVGFITLLYPELLTNKLAMKLPQGIVLASLFFLFAGAWTLRLIGVFPLPLSP